MGCGADVCCVILQIDTALQPGFPCNLVSSNYHRDVLSHIPQRWTSPACFSATHWGLPISAPATTSLATALPSKEDGASSSSHVASPMKLITLYAAFLLLAGIALLFAPEEMGALTHQAATGPALFVQLLGAAFIGFAASNWITRHAPVGGIYGRAVVVGNLTFSAVGALALLGSFPAAPRWGFWMLLTILAAGSVLHSVLLFRGPPDR